MSLEALRSEMVRFLALAPPPARVTFTQLGLTRRDEYDELRITFTNDDGERVPAFLLMPHDHAGIAGGALVQHQHASEWHLGKSEVVGLLGDPWQAFGPSLARRGFIVLAPDSICFEDRRTHVQGTTPGPGESDWAHHYNAMAFRLVRGDTLMRRVLTDALTAFSLLAGLPELAGRPIGTLGHSYGGNTVLFHAAIDVRVRFACASGAACSYRHKLAIGTGIEMAEIIPGFAARWDIEDLVRATAPRPLLLVSGEQDPYSADADQIERLARDAYERLGAGRALQHRRDPRAHAMTNDRFEHILNWVGSQAEVRPLS